MGIITVSDSRAAAMKEGQDEDISGKIVQEKLEEAGFLSNRVIVSDEIKEIEEKVDEFVSDSEINMIITTGGTGLTSRDKTVNVVREFFDKELPGFGETLRRLGYEKVGLPGVLTRTTAGLSDQKPIVCLPGTPNAVEIGMDLLVSDLEYLVKQAQK